MTAKATLGTIVPDNGKIPYVIVGVDADGARGAQLAQGASIEVTSADPTIGTIVPDATPGLAADGLQSIASGFFVPTNPAKVGVPVQVNYAITNADGTAGHTGFGTVTVVAGTETSESVEFGAPVAQ
jgi:hypothetical protein